MKIQKKKKILNSVANLTYRIILIISSFTLYYIAIYLCVSINCVYLKWKEEEEIRSKKKEKLIEYIKRKEEKIKKKKTIINIEERKRRYILKIRNKWEEWERRDNII